MIFKVFVSLGIFSKISLGIEENILLFRPRESGTDSSFIDRTLRVYWFVVEVEGVGWWWVLIFFRFEVFVFFSEISSDFDFRCFIGVCFLLGSRVVKWLCNIIAIFWRVLC